MNKYQEALNYLRMLERQDRLFFTNQFAPQVNCDVLQELVDKVTLKKVQREEHIYDCEEYVYTRGVCPICGQWICYDEVDKYDYCQYCGQHLDWGEL